MNYSPQTEHVVEQLISTSNISYSNIFQSRTVEFLIFVWLRWQEGLFISRPERIRVIVSLLVVIVGRWGNCYFMMKFLELTLVGRLELAFDMRSWASMLTYIN